MRIEVFCDNPVKIVRYLATMIPAMGDEPYRMKVHRCFIVLMMFNP